MKLLIKHVLNSMLFSFGKINPIIGPLRVHWDITELCNSKCRHCIRWKIKKSKTDLNFEQCCRIIDWLKEVGTNAISFSGNEPLMRKDIYDLIKYATKKGMNTSINTNCIMLNKKRIESLINNGLGTFVFSIDSINKNTHDFLRGVPGNFDKIFESARLIRKASKNVKIQATMVVSKKNVSQIYQIAKKCKENDFDKFIIQPIHNIPRFFETERQLILNEEDVNEIKNQISKTIREFSGFIASPKEYLNNFKEFILNKERLYRYRCSALYITADIRSNGDVVPCPVGFIKIGNLKKKAFKEIWFSKEANEVRKNIKKNKHPICWFSCIQPINIVLHNFGKGKVSRLLDINFLKHAISKIK